MRAVWYEQPGAAREVLRSGELPTPRAGPGEVRVRLSTSGVNPVDVKRRRGGRGAMAASRIVPHFDGAGVVDEVGSGVPESRLGERVWVHEAQWQRDAGTAAEWVALPAHQAVPLPGDTSFAQAACLGIPAMTAHRCVFADGEVRGLTLLVTGGAGAVGRYAVQFAKLEGATVIATTSSEDKARSARAAGADHVVDYREEDVGARVAEITGGAGVDRVVEVELGGNLDVSLQVLRPGGVIAAYASEARPEPVLPFYRLLYASVCLRHVLVFQAPEEAKRRATADLDRWLRAGRLTHDVGPSFALEDAARAHEAVESGVSGKVLLEIGG